MACEDDDPGLPIGFGPASNGEYDPIPWTPTVREAVRRARQACDEGARRTGMTRREFMLSLAGAATTLLALDACTRESMPPRTEPGGRFDLAPEATLDPEAAGETLEGEEFVFDVQGHLLEYEMNPAARSDTFWMNFPQQYCGEDDPRVCFSIDHFMQEMFLRSDTTMIALSALPINPETSPLSLDVMEETRRVTEALCEDERLLLHGLALPNVGPLRANLDAMEDLATRHGISAWKTFTHYPAAFGDPGNAWWFDDHDKSLPQVGEAFIEKAAELGVPRICTHKGLSSGSPFASPDDVGPAAKAHPDVAFIVYHSGFEVDYVEGPYSRSTRHVGINRLITSMRRAGVGPNENVYAELGSTWWNVMRDPTQAAHVLGKLLKYVGEDNVLWGTDCLFYGSPQGQIQALRAFRITEAFQERYGYPRLSKEIKAKILGLNAARVYGVDPVTVPCKFTKHELREARKSFPGVNKALGPSSSAEVRVFREHHQGWP
jgi:uncharacterized protein